MRGSPAKPVLQAQVFYGKDLSLAVDLLVLRSQPAAAGNAEVPLVRIVSEGTEAIDIICADLREPCLRQGSQR